jgi:hypothetical protein
MEDSKEGSGESGDEAPAAAAAEEDIGDDGMDDGEEEEGGGSSGVDDGVSRMPLSPMSSRDR